MEPQTRQLGTSTELLRPITRRGNRIRIASSIVMNLAPVPSQFGSEDGARAYLEQLRWPDGVRCPRCTASKGISRIEGRGQFDCDSCGYQFSVRVGTSFHASHLPLWKWMLAVFVISESEEGVSANQLKKMLGVSYKTAWYLCHRIRAAMHDEAPATLRKIVDESDGARLDERSLQARRPRGRTNAVWSSFTKSVADSYHHLSAKHLSAYLDEAAFRYKNRGNAYRFRDTLLRLINSDAMPYSELVAGA
jgi:transposase-like protein